jgi:hypothetical protein
MSTGASVGSIENTASSIVLCWTTFTELLPGNALIKSVTMYFPSYVLTVGFKEFEFEFGIEVVTSVFDVLG